MAEYRLARSARRDIEILLTVSDTNWGSEGRRRYAGLLMEAFRRLASDPDDRSSRDRSDLQPGIRTFHLRHVRQKPKAAVKKPVHILIYRRAGPDLIEIVRILHERMDPVRHLASPRGGE